MGVVTAPVECHAAAAAQVAPPTAGEGGVWQPFSLGHNILPRMVLG